MNNKTLSLSCGKKIDVYQNIFTLSEREFFMNFALHSLYRIGKGTGEFNKFRNESFFTSYFSDTDDEQFQFNNSNTIKDITNKFLKSISWINATHHGSFYSTHTDHSVISTDKAQKITLLYCLNVFWDKEHGGEIMFNNSYGEKEIAVDFIPGQVIKFDSTLGHRAAFSYGHIEPRYVYVCQYVKV